MAFITGNNCTATLGAALTAAATTITVTTGQGARFPAVVAPQIMMLTLDDGLNIEVVKCTAHTAGTDTFTVVRNAETVQQNSANYAFANTGSGTVVESRMTAGIAQTGEPLFFTTQSADPTAPIIGGLQLYSKSVGGRTMIKWLSPAGVDYVVQPALFGNNAIVWKPWTGASGSGTGFGAAWNVSGTVTHPTLTTTAPAIVNATRRTRYTSATTANANAGIYQVTAASQAAVWRGNATGLGGFFFHARVVDGNATAATRMFVGLTALTTPITAAEPVSGANSIGFGYNTTDATTNYFIMTNNGTTAVITPCTIVTARAANSMFDVYFFSPPNGSYIHCRINAITTAGAESTIYDADITTNLLSNTSFLIPQVMKGTASSVTAMILDIEGVYVESDY